MSWGFSTPGHHLAINVWLHGIFNYLETPCCCLPLGMELVTKLVIEQEWKDLGILIDIYLFTAKVYV